MSVSDALLAEQIAYCQTVAAEYDSHSLHAPGVQELVEAIESFRPEGSVLELACGRGRWTAELLRYASEETAPSMPLLRFSRLPPSA